MISAGMVSAALGVQVINNPQMEISVRKWGDMYRNTASWNSGRIISLCLASAISREFSRLVLAETEVTVDGDKYISEQFRKLIPKLPVMVEQACAMGGIIVKPYLSNGRIYVDTVLPKGRERMFRTYDIQVSEKPFIETFSPEIRDISLFNGLNRIFQRIEFNCGLAYGTLSDPQTVEKTAEEVRTSKQRSYTQVSAIQKNLEFTLENLLYAYNYYAEYFGLSKSDAKLICTWDDSVLEDTDKEFQRRLQMVNAGLLSKEKFISWYFHCDEKQAAEYIPQVDALFGGM